MISQFFPIEVPCFSTIRNWLYKFGLYELSKEIEHRQDWIFILDHTVELGKVKCLVVLAVSLEAFKKSGFQLQHKDMVALHIEPMEYSNGELIFQRIVCLAEQVGTPVQIITDHGSDIFKGTSLFVDAHPEVVYTYDITHKMACLLKNALEGDSDWTEFLAECSAAIKQIQQTELLYLAPPKQRTKARYSDIDKQIGWAENMLEYEERGDFSEISTGYTLTTDDLACIQEIIKQGLGEPLDFSPMVGVSYTNVNEISDALRECMGKELFEWIGGPLVDLGSIGLQRFMDKFGWLGKHKEQLAGTYSPMVQLVKQAQSLVKQEGLRNESSEVFQERVENIVCSPHVEELKNKITEYLKLEGAKVPSGEALLGTSDIIESSIGKYKTYSKRSPIKEAGKALLTIPAFMADISGSLVKKALERTRYREVEEWSKSCFGKSAHSKRRAALSPILGS